MTNRREFLQTSAAFAGSFILPQSIFATPSSNFHFIHTDTLNQWPVTDPVQWSLEHAHEPILARAFDGLCSLSTSDSDRIIRLMVRRCGLNLIEVNPKQVLIHHWSHQLADLRSFFKANHLTSPDVRVTLIDRKKEIATNKTGDDFLYGKPIAKDFPIKLFTSKWNNRFQQEHDDHLAASRTNSGLAWDGLELGRIPWVALKSAWQNSQPTSCLNCSGESILVNFGYRQVGVFNRSPNFVSVCPHCRRSYVDDSITDVAGWTAANLKTDFCPVGEVVWGKRLERV